jgi:hypothetical protein
VFEHGVVGKRLEAVPFVAVPHVTDPVAAASDHRLSVRAVRGAHGFAGHSSLPAAASGTVVVPGIAAFEVRGLRELRELRGLRGLIDTIDTIDTIGTIDIIDVIDIIDRIDIDTIDIDTIDIDTIDIDTID